MFSTYLRLRVHTHASARDVIRALYGRMRPESRAHVYRTARHEVIRQMLDYHASAQNLHYRATK